MNVRLIRYHYGLNATLGILKFPVVHQPIYTLELPWRENQHDISCIPVGVYDVIPHNSVDHPGTFEVTNVPNRSSILIHVGNYPSDFKGCIGVGTGVSPSTPMISSSNIAMDKVRDMGGDGFVLTVESA
jgi:hypothetical protein